MGPGGLEVMFLCSRHDLSLTASGYISTSGSLFLPSTLGFGCFFHMDFMSSDTFSFDLYVYDLKK